MDDDEDMTWPVGDVPGVAALAGLDPAEDLRRENAELRAILQLSIDEWRRVEMLAKLQQTQLNSLVNT